MVATGINDFVVTVGIWFVKSFLKKLNESWPSTEYIATRDAESIPSLKNLRPKPGASNYSFEFGSAATESLTTPWSPPVKIPVKGCWPLLVNLTVATAP